MEAKSFCLVVVTWMSMDDLSYISMCSHKTTCPGINRSLLATSVHRGTHLVITPFWKCYESLCNSRYIVVLITSSSLSRRKPGVFGTMINREYHSPPKCFLKGYLFLNSFCNWCTWSLSRIPSALHFSCQTVI